MIRPKPVLPLLQRAHPLARQLTAAWLMYEGAGDITHNLVRPDVVPTSTGTIVWGLGANGRRMDFDNSRIDSDDVFGMGNADATVFCSFHLGTASTHGALVKVGGNRPESGGIGTGYAMGVGANTLDINGNDLIGLFEDVRWIDTNQAIGTGNHTAALVLNAGTPSFYLDGALVGSYGGSGANAPTVVTHIGGYLNEISDDRQPDADIYAALLYTRALSTREIALLHHDPYQAFRPAVEKLVYAAATQTAPSTITARVAWTDNSDDEDGFSIERSTDGPTSGFSEIDTVGVGVTQYDDEELSPDTYWYRVRAYRGSVYGDYSNVVEITTS